MGPIVGGVLGGIAAIMIAVFLVWWFCVRKRKQEADKWGTDAGSEKDVRQRYSTRQARNSTHTVASIASTAYTRASNIIQIAYIPGVTNRSAHSSPDLIPPVPPIPSLSPIGSAANSPYTSGEEQHYFMPADLRNSAYSGYTDRSSMARGSIASTIYRDNAVVNPLPAQAVPRLKATAVSVKSSSKTSPNASRSTSPRPPGTGYSLSPKSSHPLLRNQSSIVGRIGTPRQVTLTRKSSKNSAPAVHELDGGSGSAAGGGDSALSPFAGTERRGTPPNHSGISPPPPVHRGRHHSGETSLLDEPFDDDEEEDVSSVSASPPASTRAAGAAAGTGPPRRGHARDHSHATTIPEENGGSGSRPGSVLSSLAASTNRGARDERRESLNAIIQEATRRATQIPRHGGLGFRPEDRGQDPSPFSDEHAAGTP